MRMVKNRYFDHVETMFGCRQIRIRFVRRNGARHKEHLIQTELVLCLISNDQVREMDWVEGAPEKAQSDD